MSNNPPSSNRSGPGQWGIPSYYQNLGAGNPGAGGSGASVDAGASAAAGSGAPSGSAASGGGSDDNASGGGASRDSLPGSGYFGANPEAGAVDGFFKMVYDEMRVTRDFFMYHRQCKVNDWDEDERAPIYLNTPIPTPGKYEGLAARHSKDPPKDLLWERDNVVPYPFLPPSGPGTGASAREIKTAGRVRAAGLVEDLDAYAVTFNRVLGMGGLGLAVLFDLNNKSGGRVKQVVVKCSLDDDDASIEQEKYWHKFFRNTTHIVQSVDLQKEKKPKKKKNYKIVDKESSAGAASSTPPAEIAASHTPGPLPDPASTPRENSLRETKKRSRDASSRPLPEDRGPKRLRLGTEAEDGNDNGHALHKTRKRSREVKSGSPAKDRGPKRRRLGSQDENDDDNGNIDDDGDVNMDGDGDGDGDAGDDDDDDAESVSLSQLEGILVLEYLARGDLKRWIGKVNGMIERIPPKAVWHIMRCMMKGIVAMEYPPSCQDTFVEVENFFWDEIPPEDVDGLEHSADVVHFDIDPSNTDLGQIADLGLMEAMTAKMVQEGLLGTMEIWNHRRYGKATYYAPEQFSEEWDYITGLPTDCKVAGNWSWKANLYQVGLTLWCLLTGFHPPDGPVDPQYIGKWHNEKTGEDEDHWSYGNFLASKSAFPHADEALHRLAVDCLSDDPAHRPDMKSVFIRIRQNLELRDWGEDWTDEKLKSWSESFFEKPPVLEPPPLSKIEAWLAGEITFEEIHPPDPE